MNPRRAISSALLLAAVSLAGNTRAAAPEAVSYELGFERPNTHLMDVTIRAGGLGGPFAEFAIPNWAPGAYSITEYARMVQEFSAAAPDGHPLMWQKTDAQTWRIELAGATSVTVKYKLYGNTLQNNWVQYNEQHAAIAGPATWMYLVGGKQRSARLTIHVPETWRVATGLAPAGEDTFTAPDYDTFADSPIEISNFTEKTFTVLGTTYHVIVHDVMGRTNSTAFTKDLQRVVQTIVPTYKTVTGGSQTAPFLEYWFLFHIWPHAGGGLEHLNSTQISYSSDWASTAPSSRFFNDYDLKLFVAAHEFYHAWNVKRIRPKPLGPFDYTREVHTPSLWISEGLTSYYAELAMVRAGLITPEQYLDSIGRLITSFEQEPGRSERSIAETSWDTWFSRRGQGVETNLANTDYSYYDGGQIVGHLLDFAIRRATQNRKSLDDWMRLLYERYALPKPGFEPTDAVRAASEIAGTDLSDFFRRYINGKESLPYAEYFAAAGIQVEKRMDTEHGWLGLEFDRDSDGRARIRNLIPGGPAEQSGLDRGDVVVGAENNAFDREGLERWLRDRKPGEPVKFTIIRSGALKDVLVNLGADPYATYTLVPMENPTSLQREIYRDWLGLR